ncbi:MAG: Bifunctional protein GlmU [Pseudomonadota bacterium]
MTTRPPQPLQVAIMAAGKGTRMKSTKPKVLQTLAGLPLLDHVIATAQRLNASRTVVITGHQAESVESAVRATWQDKAKVEFALQMPQLGTGHAMQQAAHLLDDDATVLVLSGDVPLTETHTLERLIQASEGQHLALLSVHLADPSGYGRIVRSPSGAVEAIVEHKDASEAQRQIGEVYSGIMAAPARALKSWLLRLNNHNAQQEYYLTDVVTLALQDGVQVMAVTTDDPMQVEGVNSPRQLAALERVFQLRQANKLMDAGVRLADPSRVDVRGELVCGQDVEIDVNCVFSGRVELGNNVRIGAHCVLSDCTLADGVQVHPFTHIDGQNQAIPIGAGSLIGPFARLRPGAKLGQDVHIGNFVEVKNSTLADGAKANHLAYLGDAVVGERVNYGAGSITANYDGANKHKTTIQADVHVGSNCVLVAPVTIGAGGTIGAGSTITKDTPENALSVTRAKQLSVDNWARPVKKKTS